MAKYRKKPVVIEALQVPLSQAQTEEWVALMKWLFEDAYSHGGNYVGHVDITTLEGTMRAIPGDWIIKGVKGEFYLCKPDIFGATYEPA
jgi:hypothetical protein